MRIGIHGPEKVDSFEIGTKNCFEGRFPGTFNVAAFYSDFRDQQLQNGILTSAGTGSTAIVYYSSQLAVSQAASPLYCAIDSRRNTPH